MRRTGSRLHANTTCAVSVSTALSLALALCAIPKPAGAEFFDPELHQRPSPEADPQSPPEEKGEYDPLSGLDSNGRIPSIGRPDYLAHPERWRYLPEGRLKPGNVLQRFFVSSFIVPYAFSSGDLGTGGGLAITDLDFRGQRRREMLAVLLSYSSAGQQEYELKWQRWLHHIDIPDGGILQEERSFIRAEIDYRDTLTLRFFGLGGDTEAAGESSYRDKLIFGELGFERSLPDPGSNWVVQAGLVGESHNLSSGHVSSVPSMEEVYPEIFEAAEQHNMGWLKAGLRYDTRDSQQNPYSGWHAGTVISWVPVQTGGGMGARYSLTAGKVFRMFSLFHDGGDAWEENPPTDTLAFGFWNDYTSGKLPFFALPTQGGPDQQRGFIAGRFHGRASWLLASEYRFWFLPRGFALTKSIRVERVGAAFFYEVGAVSNRAGTLFQERPRHTYGVSLRVSVDRTNPLRFDFGFSEDGMQFAFGYGLTF